MSSAKLPPAAQEVQADIPADVIRFMLPESVARAAHDLMAAIEAGCASTPAPAAQPVPIDMILYCPNCGVRPADVPTNGVASVKTAGKADTWPVDADEIAAQSVALTDACNGLDTPERVRFYEHDFYVLSNFSAFEVRWNGLRFPTSEHAYHYEKFPANNLLRSRIRNATSAHDAFKLAEANKEHRRKDWDAVKVDIMRRILFAKADQHEYVCRKLLATGDRELVEDSWRDDYWGWGPNRDGLNMLGKLWMEVRAVLAAQAGKGRP